MRQVMEHVSERDRSKGAPGARWWRFALGLLCLSAFVGLLNKSGFSARAEMARARGEKGSKHTIFLAKAG